MRLVACFGVLKDLRFLRPGREALMVGLVVQEPTNAGVVAQSPEDKDHSKDRYPPFLWQKVK